MQQLSDKQKKDLDKTISNYMFKRKKLQKELNFEEIQKKVTDIRNNDIKKLDSLWKKAKKNFESSGIKIHMVKDKSEAKKIFSNISNKNDKIVKSKSNVIDELNLSSIRKIIPTDIGDWIVNELNKERNHPIIPSAYIDVNEIKQLAKKHGYKNKNTSKELVDSIKRIIKDNILSSDIGLTGANIITSEGHIVLIENEGNISLVSRIPKKHIVITSINKITDSLENAMTLAKCMAIFGTSQKSTAYINIISSPSSTSDIQNESVIGVQGPSEIHLIVVDNGRTKLLENKKKSKVLNCINCGGCLYFCPAFKELGNKFGTTYLGGHGIILSSVISKNSKEIFSCLGCEACEQMCPVGVKVYDNIKKIRKNENSFENKKIREEILEKGNAVEDSNTWELKK